MIGINSTNFFQPHCLTVIYLKMLILIFSGTVTAQILLQVIISVTSKRSSLPKWIPNHDCIFSVILPAANP